MTEIKAVVMGTGNRKQGGRGGGHCPSLDLEIYYYSQLTFKKVGHLEKMNRIPPHSCKRFFSSFFYIHVFKKYLIYQIQTGYFLIYL